MTFSGSTVRARRIARGMDRYDLAEATQTSYLAVWKWESGATVPRADTLPLLAAALGCSIDDLFADGDEVVDDLQVAMAP